jgi:hypothetical protein
MGSVMSQDTSESFRFFNLIPKAYDCSLALKDLAQGLSVVPHNITLRNGNDVVQCSDEMFEASMTLTINSTKNLALLNDASLTDSFLESEYPKTFHCIKHSIRRREPQGTQSETIGKSPIASVNTQIHG